MAEGIHRPLMSSGRQHQPVRPPPAPALVARILTLVNRDELVAAVKVATTPGTSIALNDDQHTQGRKQFATNAWLLDLRQHAALRAFEQITQLSATSPLIKVPVANGRLASSSPPGR